MRCYSWAPAAILFVAGTAPSFADTLSERRFLDDVVARHPEVGVAEAGVAAAAGHRRQAGLADNPVLSWEREDLSEVAREDTWRLSWRLPFDGRKHRLAAADASVAASKAELEAVRFDIRREMRALFASWYLAVERVAVLREQLEHTRRLAARIRARADEGEAAGVEARRLELEVEILSRRSAEAEADARALVAAAATWSQLVVQGARPGRPLLAPPPAAVDVGARSDLEVLAHRLSEAEARDLLQRRVVEPPEVTVGWMEVGDTVESVEGPVFELAWPLPVFDRHQGRRQTAEAEVDRVRSELETATRRAEQQANAALASYAELYRAAVPTVTTPADGLVFDAVLAAFEAGEAGLTDVLDSLRTTVEVRLARLESLGLAMAAERELETAIGRTILPGGSS